jgi:hypothetical protein
VNTEIRESSQMQNLQPEVIAAFLNKRGWQKIFQPNPDLIVFQGMQDDLGNIVSLVLPQHNRFLDSQFLIDKAINLLAIIENKSVQAILSEISASQDSNSTVSPIIELKSQYEQMLTEAYTNASHLREQLSHVNALLFNQLVPSRRAASLQSSPRPLLSAYEGLTRLEAISQVLQRTPGQEVTIDALIHGLFGDLNAAEHKSERLKLKTLMYQGEKRKLWHKGSAPSSYLIKRSEGRGRGSKTATPVTEVSPPKQRRVSRRRYVV